VDKMPSYYNVDAGITLQYKQSNFHP